MDISRSSDCASESNDGIDIESNNNLEHENYHQNGWKEDILHSTLQQASNIALDLAHNSRFSILDSDVNDEDF